MPGQPAPKKPFRKWLLLIPAVIVLAIIVDIVFLVQSPQTTDKLANPALQHHAHNTERQQDAAQIMSSISQYANKCNGDFPQSAATGIDAPGGLFLSGPTCADVIVAVGLDYYQPDAVSFHAYASGLTVPDANSVYIVNDATCNARRTGLGSQPSASQHTVALLYALAASSGPQQTCLGL
jgi:hypothetical protein